MLPFGEADVLLFEPCVLERNPGIFKPGPHVLVYKWFVPEDLDMEFWG